MPISKDLFLAILSMDAYNRGYGAGLSDGEHIENGVDLGLGEALGAGLGTATISKRLSDVSDTFAAEAQAAGFYAIAYKVKGVDGIADGTTVISYRGDIRA
jgi:cytosine/adenosine deaminase-related metal-dependent hydrolase